MNNSTKMAIVVAGLAGVCLVAPVQAEIVYRGMFIDAGHPQTGNDSGNKLGVRDVDVVTYEANEEPWVRPLNDGAPQGVSVSFGSPCNLPTHRRPPGPPWNGNGSVNLHIWSIDTVIFTQDQLQYIEDPNPLMPNHGFIAPGEAMPLATYRGYVIGTANDWAAVPDPDPACPPLVVGKDQMTIKAATELALEVERHASNRAKNTAALEQLMRKANAAGLDKKQILHLLTSAATRAEKIGHDASAERLRTLCDRIVGFCGKHAIIPLK